MKRALLSCFCRPGVRLRALLAVLLGMFAASVGAADVRILIDVSGSMKQNDPKNLRVPAMRLVSELLPAGTRAGVWLFAEDAQVLLPPADVDKGWRLDARARLDDIHSRGLFTHIERAIDAATAGWETEPDPGERHIVLLTDGMVDVAKTPGASAASRARILEQQLQRVRALGARIHAVALSDNVDRELLDALTGATSGLLEKADSAERLQRIFLHMLEQTAAPVTVPLVGNEFDLDTSVTEVTLLIFRADGQAVTLYPPGGEPITAQTTADNVIWRSEAGYDLITIAAPDAGSWRFDGAVDPDNRAVIVTDLAIAMDAVPGTLLASEVIDLNVWLTDAGARIERMDLLELVRSEVRIEGDGFAPVAGAMPLNTGSFQFESRLDGRALTAGDYRLSVLVDSGTFKRELNRRVRFLPDPLAVTYSHEDAAPETVRMTLTADPELLNVASLSGYLAVTDTNGNARAFPLPETASGIIEVDVPASIDGAHQFAPNIYFTTRYGRSLHLEPEPHVVEMTAPQSEVVEEASEVVEEPVFSPAFAAVYVMLANGVLVLGFAAIWWLFRPRARSLPDAETRAAADAAQAEGEPA